MKFSTLPCISAIALAACSGAGSTGFVNENPVCSKDEFTDEIRCNRPVYTFSNSNVSTGAQSFNASMLTVDTNSTSVGLPATVVMTVALKNGSGQVQAQKAFKADLAGTDYVVAKPYLLENWLIQNGASSNSIEVYIPTLPIQTVSGDNNFTFRLRYDGQQLGTNAQTWFQECGSENGGNPFESC